MFLPMSGCDRTADAQGAAAVLGSGDPGAVDILNRDGKGPFVLGCEHAGNLIPQALGDLGLSGDDLTRHIAWDIGARRLCTLLSRDLDSPAVLQRYSRLVYDCNRSPGRHDAIATLADGSEVAGNLHLTDAERMARIEAIYRPFHRQLAALIESRRSGAGRLAYVAIHSFNESLNGHQRPWQIGFIHNQHSAMSRHLIGWFRRNTDFCIGDNQPYSPLDAVDHTIRIQAEARGVPCTMIEIRNDLLRSDADIAHWAGLLARALRDHAANQLS